MCVVLRNAIVHGIGYRKEKRDGNIKTRSNLQVVRSFTGFSLMRLDCYVSNSLDCRLGQILRYVYGWFVYFY